MQQPSNALGKAAGPTPARRKLLACCLEERGWRERGFLFNSLILRVVLTLVVTEAAVLDGTMQLYCKDMYRCGADVTRVRYHRREKWVVTYINDVYISFRVFSGFASIAE